MRILVLLAQYYPMVNPNVYRWSAVAEQWVAQGHAVHILCTRRRGVADEAEIKDVQVHRAGQATLLDWAYNLLGTQQRRAEVGENKAQKSRFFRQMLEWIVDHSWRRFYWPDGSCLWYFPGKKRALELQKQFQFDAIISVSLPFTANLIAATVKKQFPDVKWLMDIEDPFAFSDEFWVNNFQLYRKKNFRAEAHALGMADAVSVTVHAAKRKYIQHFPDLNLETKLSVTPPLANKVQNIDNQNIEAFIKNKVHLAYFGTFYEGVRMPDTFLQLLKQLFIQNPALRNQLQVHFFGEMPAKALARFDQFPDLQSNIQLHGLVSRETVAAAIQQTDFLLNIGNTTNYHLPSKSAEYLMSSKPIINICQHAEDTFQEFMQHYPLVINLHTHDKIQLSKLADRLEFFIQKNRRAHVPQTLIQQLVQPYTTAAVAERYLRLLR